LNIRTAREAKLHF